MSNDTITELMKLSDAYANASFEQGLNQSVDTPVPEQCRSALDAALQDAITSQQAEIERLRARLTALERQEAAIWQAIDPETGERLCDEGTFSTVANDLDHCVPLYLAAGAQPASASPVNRMLLELLRDAVDSFSPDVEGGEADEWVAASRAAISEAEADMLAAPQPASAAVPTTCSYCDGTGDVHSADGEWRGVCNCAQPASLGVNAQHQK